MILKLCGPGTDLFVSADSISTEALGSSTVASVYRGDSLAGKYLIGSDEHFDYTRGYVMEAGRTVDRILPPQQPRTS